jgi:hypothetical protein
LRLGAGEDLDIVKLQFLKAGFGVQEHQDSTKLQTGFSQEQTLSTKSPVKADIDVKMSKVNNLQSSGPEFFGNSSQH